MPIASADLDAEAVGASHCANVEQRRQHAYVDALEQDLSAPACKIMRQALTTQIVPMPSRAPASVTCAAAVRTHPELAGSAEAQVTSLSCRDAPSKGVLRRHWAAGASSLSPQTDVEHAMMPTM